MDISVKDVYEARARIRKYTRKTPLFYSHTLSSIYGAEVYLKLENFQVTGSFKVRGVFNKLLKHLDKYRHKVIITASMGNHAIALSYASRILGLKSIIVVPSNITKIKKRRIENYGGEILIYGKDYDEAEHYARKLSEEKNYVYVSPYNDIDMIEGNATISLEVIEENPNIDTLLVPVGGGGLISGISFLAKNFSNQIRVLGVQSEASPAMYESVKRGKIVKVNLYPSIAEGLHGNIEEDSITFEFVKRFVDEILLVSEEDIKIAIKTLYELEGIIVEGAAAVTLAALKRYKEKFMNSHVCLVLSGGNIDPKHFIEVWSDNRLWL